jgi:hypothetical protein
MYVGMDYLCLYALLMFVWITYACMDYLLIMYFMDTLFMKVAAHFISIGDKFERWQKFLSAK